MRCSAGHHTVLHATYPPGVLDKYVVDACVEARSSQTMQAADCAQVRRAWAARLLRTAPGAYRCPASTRSPAASLPALWHRRHAPLVRAASALSRDRGQLCQARNCPQLLERPALAALTTVCAIPPALSSIVRSFCGQQLRSAVVVLQRGDVQMDCIVSCYKCICLHARWRVPVRSTCILHPLQHVGSPPQTACATSRGRCSTAAQAAPHTLTHVCAFRLPRGGHHGAARRCVLWPGRRGR